MLRSALHRQKHLCHAGIYPARQNGWLLENDDVQELRILMEKLLLDGQAMAAAVQADREYYLKEYAWDTVADRIIRVLQRDGYLDPQV